MECLAFMWMFAHSTGTAAARPGPARFPSESSLQKVPFRNPQHSFPSAVPSSFFCLYVGSFSGVPDTSRLLTKEVNLQLQVKGTAKPQRPVTFDPHAADTTQAAFCGQFRSCGTSQCWQVLL